MSKIFKINKKSEISKARLGTLTLPNGVVQTPVFMPIGTVGSVKSLTAWDLEQLNAEIILGNTYHLWLNPNLEVLKGAGGLHNFNQWKKPILTDSGGFQAFSLSKIRKFKEEGVTFKTPIGETRFLSPEISMQIQTVIGSDIALVLDECLPAEVSEREARRALWRTRRWAERSKIEFERLRALHPHNNVLFGIPQGAQYPHLRKESALLTMELDFEGYSIGGVANGGEPEESMYEQVSSQIEILEEWKPKHLLGVGTPKDIIEMVKRGVDMFDCVYPTRNARHGSMFRWVDIEKLEWEGYQIGNKKFEMNFEPINKDSKFVELRSYSKAYLRQQFKAKEILASRLATLNNLEFYIQLMHKIREKIANGTF